MWIYLFYGIGVYPRVCGGNKGCVKGSSISAGLSPRVRGKLLPCYRLPILKGSIPACAGETRGASFYRCIIRVYPRVCGGNINRTLSRASRRGLSPRVRGKHDLGEELPLSSRSIPACAGETSKGADPIGVSTVYPRVCGGNNVHPRG